MTLGEALGELQVAQADRNASRYHGRCNSGSVQEQDDPRYTPALLLDSEGGPDAGRALGEVVTLG